MKSPLLTALSALWLTCGLPSLASAAWIPDGVPICGVPCSGAYDARILHDGLGGAFVAYTDYRAGQTDSDDIFMQHLTASGALAPGWPASGLPVAIAAEGQRVQQVVPDGFGGVLLVWYDHRNVNSGLSQDIYAQRILADGSIAPGWPINGAPAMNAIEYQTLPVIASDGEGGAFIAWEDWRDAAADGRLKVFAQHLTATGEPAPGWPVNGLKICDEYSQGYLSVLEDGAGGAWIAWTDGRRGGGSPPPDVYGTRITASGEIAAGWPVDGKLLAFGHRYPTLWSDGTGGFYLASSTPASFIFFVADYYVQRFSAEGEPAPGWPTGGLRVCGAPGERGGEVIALDAAGGLLMSWYDYRSPSGGSDVYAARIIPGGTLAPGWPTDGLLVSDPAEGLEFDVGITPDGAGGAYVAWEWESFDRKLRLQHFDPDGAIAQGWPQFGHFVAPTSSQFQVRMAPDGAGGTIIVWQERGGCCSRIGLFAQKFVASGIVATQLALASFEALPDRVTLIWQGVDASQLAATVYRRDPATEWRDLGTPSAEATDRLRYEDRAVSPGTRYAYRLSHRDGEVERFTDETWVEVPRAFEFALAGLRPNPAIGTPRAAFSLPDDSPARLDLLDVSGRRIASRDVGSLGAGQHVVALEEAHGIEPGIYWLRLTRDGEARTVRGVVSR